MVKLFLFLISLFFFVSCSSKKEEKDKSVNNELKNIVESIDCGDITFQAKHYADSLLITMTLEERVGQTFMPELFSVSDSLNLEYLEKLINDYHIGGVVLMRGDRKSAKKISEIGYDAKIPLFIAIDAEWGLGMRLVDAPIFPKNGFIKKDVAETLLFDYGREVARESKESGINMVLGPVIDIVESNKGIIGSRSFGGDAERVANLGIAYAKGLESGGIISVAKHFPGHGNSATDSHKRVAIVKRSISELDSMDFYPFKRYIESGLSGIMVGHLQISAINPAGEPATVSSEILTTLLREEMGFKGLVITDAFNMGGVKDFSAYNAIEAGADIVIAPENLKNEIKEILDRIKNGDLDSKIIDDRCKQILFYKALFGLWNKENTATEGTTLNSNASDDIIKNLNNSLMSL